MQLDIFVRHFYLLFTICALRMAPSSTIKSDDKLGDTQMASVAIPRYCTTCIHSYVLLNYPLLLFLYMQQTGIREYKGLFKWVGRRMVICLLGKNAQIFYPLIFRLKKQQLWDKICI